MPKCVVWSCKNSSNNIRIKDGVSFFHYPRDPLLASQWWAVLGPVVTDSFKPATAVVCSDHFHNDHKYMCKKRHRLTRNAVPDSLLLGPASTQWRTNSTLPQYNDLESSDDEANMIVDIPEILRPPSESTVCRVCLLTEGRMKRVTEDNYEDAYKQVTGIKWNKEDKLPQHLCWECGQRLRAAARFKKKALAAHNLLHELRSDHNFMTLNDIKLIDRRYHQLVSNLTQKHFPPNQYLSHTTINNNKIFSEPETILMKLLKSDSNNKYTDKTNVINVHEDVETKDEKQFSKNHGHDKLGINTDNSNLTNAYNNLNSNGEDLSFTEIYKNVKPKTEDTNLPTYKNLEGNYNNLSLTDTYKNSNLNSDITNLDTYKNIQFSTDIYNNVNTNGESYLPTYKSLDTNDSLKLADTYMYSNQFANDSNSVTYKSTENNLDTYKNLNPNPIFTNLETKELPAYNNLEANKTEDTEKNDTDSNTVKDDIENYDSDESDILVIDAGNDTNLLDNVPVETVIKSEYVGASDGGMSIDELIDIYNNDGDGDERLQELNDKFGDEATVKIEQGWGTQRKTDSNPRREKKTQEIPAQRMRPKSCKPGDVLPGNSSRSRAYEKLNQTLFTLTPVSEAEQIAEIFKRQDTFRFKRAPFKCYLCFRSFQARLAYDTHMLRHDASNGAFECTVCKARQKTLRAVKTHMYGQHTVKISCNDCNFVTMNRSVARSHEKWHAGTIYQCPHCPTQFDQESTYKGHLRTRHVHAFACAICGFTFVSRKGLAVHRCKRHADADQIPLLGPYCEACELRFVSEEAYTRHLKLSSRHRPENSPSNIRN